MKNSHAVNFLTTEQATTKNKLFVATHFFVLISLVFNMSMMGVFFVTNDAFACHGELNITKVTTKDSQKNFNFSGDIGNFSLKNTETFTYNFSQQKPYTITEELSEDWQLKNITCDDNYNYTVDLVNQTMTINITGDGTANCTFINEQKNDECVCDGQVSTLSLRYLGADTSLISIEQNDGTVAYSGTVASGDIFDLTGQSLQGTFGPELEIFVNGESNTKIHTSCSIELYTGMIVGDFVIIGGESKNNGEFCETEPYCGDYILDKNEECDDGNIIDGDGCNANCEYEMKKVPVTTCTGTGDLFAYQYDQLQPIETSFTSNYDQVLVFARSTASLNAEVNGAPVTMTEVASQNFAKVYSITTTPGDVVTVDGSYPENARGVQGYLAQNSSAPVYDLSTIQVVIDEARDNDMYLTPGDYSYIFFDKYTYNNNGTSDDRNLSATISDSNSDIHDRSYTKPYPLPLEGVVVNNYTITNSDTYTLSVDTDDSMYWLYSECSEPPVCGDGIKADTELCDDGNDVDNDSCNNSCEPRGELIVKKIVVGGDAVSSDWDMNVGNLLTFPGSVNGTSNWLPAGMYEVGETPNNNPHYTLTYNNECSAGLITVENGKTKTCILTNTYVPFCGDYNIDAGEECDDGPTGSANCSATCTTIPPECGDGKVDAGEECDDGNDVNNDSCNNECKNQGKLKVIKSVKGGTATSSDFTMHVGDNLSFPGSIEGTTNWLPVGMYQVGETPDTLPYTLSYGEDCSSVGYVSVVKNETRTCLLTNTYVPFCGDYNIDNGEECDDGPAGSATCSSECKTIELCEASIKGKKLDYATEAGLSDWEIVLFNGNGLFMASTTTNSFGDYEFANLCKGTYTVSEILQDGWTQMSPLDPDYHTVILTGNDSLETDKNFVNRHEVGDLKICKYEDEDGSLGSTYDQSVVNEWPFTVVIDQANVDVKTDASGCYTFNDLPAGSYNISEGVVDGWVILSPATGETSADVKVGETTTVNFYNQRYGNQGMICGYKYEDPDNNSETANTNGLSGWTIELSDSGNCATGDDWADSVVSYTPGPRNDGNQVDVVHADTNNALNEAEQDDTINYVSLGFGGTIVLAFDNIIMNGEGADIEVFETSSSTSSPASNPEKVRVYASQTGNDNDWTNLGQATMDASFDLGALSYAKYVKLVDESDNSSFAYTENGYDLDGVRAVNCRSDWQDHSSTITDDNGRYCFYGLDYDLYQVNEVMKSGWVNTTPIFLDALLKYGNEKEYNFNNYKIPEVEPYCGDGIKQSNEQCDDGNNVSGDGCSATCTTEGGGGGGGGHVYLQIVDISAECIAEDKVEITWRTNKTSTSWVSYDKDSDAIEDADVVNSSTTSTNHSVIVDGLVPYVDYEFTAHATQGRDTAAKKVNYNTDSCVEVKGEEGEPILTITKATPQEFANAGDKNVPFTIVVENIGNLTAFDAVISDVLPEGMVYSENGEITRSWEIGDLEPGGKYELEYFVDIDENVDPKILVNVADVYASNHEKVLDDADIEVLEVEVLAETGFSIAEFIGILFSVFVLFFISQKAKKFA